jgi:hypothetical protein
MVVSPVQGAWCAKLASGFAEHHATQTRSDQRTPQKSLWMQGGVVIPGDVQHRTGIHHHMQQDLWIPARALGASAMTAP